MGSGTTAPAARRAARSRPRRSLARARAASGARASPRSALGSLAVARSPRDASRAHSVDVLVTALIQEELQLAEAPERGADERYAHAAPGRYVLHRCGSDRRQVMADVLVVRRIRLRLLAQLRRRRDEARELPVLEPRGGRLPDHAAGRDGREKEPAAQALVLRRAPGEELRDVRPDLLARARGLRGEAEDARVHRPEIFEHRATRWTPRAEPSVQRGQRVRRVLARRHEVEGRAHERGLDQIAPVDRLAKPLVREAGEARPQCNVWGRRPLRLESAEAFDRVNDVELLAREQHLPREKGAVQLTKGESGGSGASDRRHSSILGESGLREPADDPDDFPLDLDIACVDRLHLAVGRLQADAVLLFEEALERGAAVLEERNDDVAIPRGVLRLHDDVIAVVDVVLDHRLAAHAQHEGGAALGRELARGAHRLGLVLVGVDRLTGGDLADDRRHHRTSAEGAWDGEGARAGGVLLEPALALELQEMVVDRGGGGEADGLGDLAHGGRVTPLGAALADEFEDLLGALLALFGHALDHTDRRF